MPANFGQLSKAGAPTNGVNEVKTLTISATGGTFTLTYSGQTTTAIAFNATAAALCNGLANTSVSL